MLSDLFQKNLDSLSAHLGTFNFISKFLNLYKESNYMVERAKNGHESLVVLDELGRSLSYHSKYNPDREAEQIVNAFYKGESHVLLFGFGMGYMAEELLDKVPDMGYGYQIFIVEPDPFVMIAALKNRDLTRLLGDERVVFYLGSDVDSIGETWNSAIDWSILESLCILEHQPSKNRFNQFFNKLLEKMKYLANRSRGNLMTLMNVGSEFHTNNFLNIPEAFGLPGVERLFDKYIGIPAVIVAAGPSLDKNIGHLKKIKGRFPIIAVDTAYRHMLRNGVKPDIVCAADSSYENSLDFVGVESETEVVLAAELMTHPDIFKIFRGKKMLSTFGGGLYPQINNLREPIGKLLCWGSVATMAFDLARNMGAAPIIFVGFDLSFSEGRLHTRGSYSEDLLYEGLHQFTSMENANAEYICERGRFKFVGAEGRVIYTDTNMKAYKEWFEDQFKQTKVEIINATEGGIVDKGVTKMTLAEAINKYFDKGSDINNILNRQLSVSVKADYDSLYESFNSIKNLIDDFKKGIEGVRPLQRDLSERIGNKLLEEIAFEDSEKLALVLGLHDKICESAIVVQWFTAINTKFVTKHIGAVARLRKKPEIKVEQWLSLVDRLFVAYEDFASYQISLLDNALFELRENCVRIKNR